MFNIQTLATGSTGNAYLISSGSEKLLLEAGISHKELFEKLEYDLDGIDHCLISHSHGDHSKGVKGLVKNGIDCYMSETTADELNINHHRIKKIEHLKKMKLGSFTILPFQLEHDVECTGYLIANSDNEKLLFITDSYYCHYKFVGITHLMIEVNYCESVLDQNILSGRVHQKMKKRLIKSHFSLENVVSFLEANDMSSLKEIHCLHLSDTNSDEKMICETLGALTGKLIFTP